MAVFAQHIPGSGPIVRSTSPSVPYGLPGGGGYDAVKQNGRRKAVQPRAWSADQDLTPTERIVLSTSTRDLQKNFAIAAWAVRKHLDYVASFGFQATTGDDKFDDAVEAFMLDWNRPENCDATGRMTLSRMIRMVEARRAVDGDVLVNRVSNGTLQGIEGDRLRTPLVPVPGVDLDGMVQGVQVDAAGKAIAYAVHRRGTMGLEFERMVSADFCDLHGYFERFDQIRGVSPLAAAINPLRDVYENIDFALMKAKVEQLFGMVITRKEGGDMADGLGAARDPNAPPPPRPAYDLDFSGGPFVLDMEPGDDAKPVTSGNPSDQFQAFMTNVIAIALKALDIPYSFYDEGHTAYSGSRQAWIQYDYSATIKREDNQNLLDRWTLWRLSLAIRDGVLTPPRGLVLSPASWQWVSRGVPWIDPLKEVTADILAARAGFIGPETLGRLRGRDVYKMILERARVEKFAREHNVSLEWTVPPIAPEPPEEVVNRKGKQ